MFYLVPPLIPDQRPSQSQQPQQHCVWALHVRRRERGRAVQRSVVQLVVQYYIGGWWRSTL